MLMILSTGGITNFGITERVARRWGYAGDMRDMQCGVAFDIYASEYWDSVQGDSLVELSESITCEVVDTGVNCGVLRAGEFLQRALNVMNKQGSLYPDLVVDGHIGGKSLYALSEYLKTRNESVLLKALNALQGARYIELAERYEKNERFIYGWFEHRVSIRGD